MGEGKGQEDTPRQAKQILMRGLSVGIFLVFYMFLDFRPPSMRESLHGAAVSPHEANPACSPRACGIRFMGPQGSIGIRWIPLAFIGLHWRREEVGGGGRMWRRREGWREGRRRKEKG